MGFMTVAFILNDFNHTLKDSPEQVIYALTYPPIGNRDKNSFRSDLDNIATRTGEPPLHGQALQVLPTFHNSVDRYFVAGKNIMEELEYYGTEYKKGIKYIVLKAPDRDQDRIK